MTSLFAPLTLPNGSVIPNRLAKAAMEENLADRQQAPDRRLFRLYQAWAEGGAGLLLTGNVMIDSRALTGPGGVVLESAERLEAFAEWARIARSGQAQVWMQLNHPGRQIFAALGQPALAPSAVAVDLGNYSHLFAQPRAMEQADIEDVIRRFANSAALAEQAGFTGVQIHAAHGYLLSQFLSPLTNKRNDRWGGSLENRARLLLAVIDAVRARVAPGFCVAVKLNSADFQRGGFEPQEALAVVRMLNDRAVDLVELSGGSYESPAMQGQSKDGRTLAREAYFLEFAKDIQQVARMPLMLTGGVRRRAVAEEVLANGVAMVGLGTALSLAPDLPADWQRGSDLAVAPLQVTWKNKAMASMAVMAVVKHQLQRLSRGRSPAPQVSPLLALLAAQARTWLRTRQYRKWIAARRSMA